MKTIYECEKCGMQFDNFDQCWDHEYSEHKYSLSIIEEKDYMQENPLYPTTIKIRMNDKAEIIYKLAEITKKAEPVSNDEEQEVA
jgi:hypothetical protein